MSPSHQQLETDCRAPPPDLLCFSAWECYSVVISPSPNLTPQHCFTPHLLPSTEVFKQQAQGWWSSKKCKQGGNPSPGTRLGGLFLVHEEFKGEKKKKEKKKHVQSSFFFFQQLQLFLFPNKSCRPGTTNLHSIIIVSIHLLKEK